MQPIKSEPKPYKLRLMVYIGVWGLGFRAVGFRGLGFRVDDINPALLIIRSIP